MYCRHCGKKINKEKEEDICLECGVLFSDERGTAFCEKCGEHVEREIETCDKCGNNLLVPNYKNISFKTKDIKNVADMMVNNKNVDKKMIFGVFYLVPFLITFIIINRLFFGITFSDKILNNICSCVVTGIIGTYLLIKGVEVIKTGRAKGRFTFKLGFSIYMIIISLVCSVGMDAISQVLGLGEITSNSSIALEHQIIQIILTIVVFILQELLYFSLYTYIAREVSVGESLKIGFTIGIKNLWNLIKMTLSFIPLIILCIITVGILSIWEGFYITVSSEIMMEKILLDNNL